MAEREFSRQVKNRPGLSRPIGARYSDPARDLGTVRTESDEQRRRRERRDYENRVAERAVYLLENDPEIDDTRAARRAAREQLAIESKVSKGVLDPDTLEPTNGHKPRKGDKPTSKGGKSGTRSRAVTRAGRARGRTATRKLSRAVVAPFGSAASAGWQLVTGGLSLVLLYVVLRDAGTVGDALDGLTGGLRRFADPYTPLLPSRNELAPPDARRRVLAARNAEARRVVQVKVGKPLP